MKASQRHNDNSYQFKNISVRIVKKMEISQSYFEYCMLINDIFLYKEFTAKHRKGIVCFDKVVIKQRKRIQLITIGHSNLILSLVVCHVICLFVEETHERQMNEIYKFIIQSNASFIFVHSLLLLNESRCFDQTLYSPL